MKKTKIDLKIGDKIYKYIWSKGAFTYEVFGVREYGNVTQYEVRCKDCNDHQPCELLVVQDGQYNRLNYVTMLNNDGEEDTDQSYYHNGTDVGSKYFYLDRKQCNIEYGTYNLGKLKEKVESSKKTYEHNLEQYNSFKLWIENIKIK